MTKLTLFAALLALAFGGAYALGATLDPDGGREGSNEMQTHTKGGELRIVVDDTRLAAGRRETFEFRIVDGDGRPVSDFEVEHERAMHLIAVRRDLTGYQHLHPRRTREGAWEAPLRFADPGKYRLFADFKSGGRSYTLPADVTVPGPYEPRPLPHPATTASAGDGYEVELAGDGGDVRFAVTRDGRPVDDVEPYLGARGHLVALREGDLEYLHVHPEDGATEGRAIRFGVEYPAKGRYRLFLQFKHEGRVRTAAFTTETGGAGHGH